MDSDNKVTGYTHSNLDINSDMQESVLNYQPRNSTDLLPKIKSDSIQPNNHTFHNLDIPVNQDNNNITDNKLSPHLDRTISSNSDGEESSTSSDGDKTSVDENTESTNSNSLNKNSEIHSSIDLDVGEKENQNPIENNSEPKKRNGSQSKSQKIVSLQNIFTEQQKIAYVGLIHLLTSQYKLKRLVNLKNKSALISYEKWTDNLMAKLYSYLDFSLEERRMIQSLSEHNLAPSDLSKSLFDQNSHHITLNNNNNSVEKIEIDIRYTVLSHLFVLSISDGTYDSRSRSLLKSVAFILKIPLYEVVRAEKAIALQLLVNLNVEELQQDNQVIQKHNKQVTRNRWALAAAAILAGGTIIGLTAGLAAPLIGAGIGAALGTIGVSGAAGVGTFMGSAAGLALITTGGALTGAGMSGYKMIKRTRGINEFEFVSLENGIQTINENKEKRRRDRRKRWRLEVAEKKFQRFTVQTNQSTDSSPNNSKSTTNSSTTSSNPNSTNPTSTKHLSPTSPNHSTQSSNTPIEEWKMEAEDILCLSDDEDELFNHHIEPSKQKSTSAIITVSGWLAFGKDDYTLPFSTIKQDYDGDQYSMIWESKCLEELGSSLTILGSEVTSFLISQGLQATILPILMAGLSGPLWALKLTYFLDNPWGNALMKAKQAGRLLADTLIAQVQENRPVKLIGYSLGARLIYYCLLELAQRNAFGIVEEAYLLGSPVLATSKEWEMVASAVSGRIVNGYLENDWVLACLYKTSSALWKNVAGLSPIFDVEGIENVQLDDIISGHLDYRTGMPRILIKLGFEVSSDHFEDQKEEEENDKIKIQQELNELRQHKKFQKMKFKSYKKLNRNVSKNINPEDFNLIKLEKPFITPISPLLLRSSVGRGLSTFTSRMPVSPLDSLS